MRNGARREEGGGLNTLHIEADLMCFCSSTCENVFISFCIGIGETFPNFPSNYSLNSRSAAAAGCSKLVVLNKLVNIVLVIDLWLFECIRGGRLSSQRSITVKLHYNNTLA